MSGALETEALPADDLRSQLQSAFADSESAAVEPAEPAAPAPTEDRPSAPERARGPDGKFVRVEGETEPPTAIEPTQRAPEAPAAVAAVPEAKAAVDPPSHWTAEDKAKFAAIPADIQQTIIARERDREADYTRKTQQVASLRRDYEPIAQLLSPHAEEMRQKGFTPASLVNAWYNVEKQLVSGGPAAVGVVKSIIEGYRLNPLEVIHALGIRIPGQEGGEAQPWAPPEQSPYAQLPPQVLQKLQELEQWRNGVERSQANAQVGAVVSHIEQFKTAKDGSGNLIHPHFDEVEDAMATIARGLRTSGLDVPPLDDLYDQAVWANPSTRSRQLAATNAAQEAQRQAAEATKIKEARAKAEQAKRAGSSVTGAPGSGQTASQRMDSSRSLRETLLEAAAEQEA